MCATSGATGGRGARSSQHSWGRRDGAPPSRASKHSLNRPIMRVCVIRQVTGAPHAKTRAFSPDRRARRHCARRRETHGNGGPIPPSLSPPHPPTPNARGRPQLRAFDPVGRSDARTPLIEYRARCYDRGQRPPQLKADAIPRPKQEWIGGAALVWPQWRLPQTVVTRGHRHRHDDPLHAADHYASGRQIGSGVRATG